MGEHEYKPNSHRYREERDNNLRERQKLDKIVTGTVKTKKKSELRKLTDIFVAEDARDVKSYIVMDVLIPTIKNTILDIIVDSATMIFKGEPARNKKRFGAEYVSYRSYSDRDRREERRYSDIRNGVGYGHDDIILENRGEAEEVLTRMDELIDAYGSVSVADLYDLIGKTCNYTDNRYGWTNLRNAEPIRVRDGYMLKLPKTTLVD